MGGSKVSQRKGIITIKLHGNEEASYVPAVIYLELNLQPLFGSYITF